MIGYDIRHFAVGGGRVAFHVSQSDGPPVVFQHGLCGDAGQTAEIFAAGVTARHHVMEARSHGHSDVFPPEALSIQAMTDDLAAIIEGSGIGPCPVGGISMGAAIALRLAVTRPDLVSALILARPAWVTDAGPANMGFNAEVGHLMSTLDAATARSMFEAGDMAGALRSDAPDNLASLLGFFDRAPQAATADLLCRISADGPGVTPGDVAALTLPTLLIGTQADAIHPFAHVTALHALLPRARVVEIPPKATDRAGHIAAFAAAVDRFLKENPHAAP